MDIFWQKRSLKRAEYPFEQRNSFCWWKPLLCLECSTGLSHLISCEVGPGDKIRWSKPESRSVSVFCRFIVTATWFVQRGSFGDSFSSSELRSSGFAENRLSVWSLVPLDLDPRISPDLGVFFGTTECFLSEGLLGLLCPTDNLRLDFESLFGFEGCFDDILVRRKYVKFQSSSETDLSSIASRNPRWNSCALFASRLP